MTDKLMLVTSLRFYLCPLCEGVAVLEMWAVTDIGDKVDIGKCADCGESVGYLTRWVDGGIYVIPFRLTELEKPEREVQGMDNGYL